MDIYRELAASILGRQLAEVTPEERRTAKGAFWKAFGAVARLPGNEHLVPEGAAVWTEVPDGVCNRCGGSPAPHLSSEICVVCAPVLLCQHCFDLHKQEIASHTLAHGLPSPGFDANNCGSC